MANPKERSRPSEEEADVAPPDDVSSAFKKAPISALRICDAADAATFQAMWLALVAHAVRRLPNSFGPTGLDPRLAHAKGIEEALDPSPDPRILQHGLFEAIDFAVAERTRGTGLRRLVETHFGEDARASIASNRALLRLAEFITPGYREMRRDVVAWLVAEPMLRKALLTIHVRAAMYGKDKSPFATLTIGDPWASQTPEEACFAAFVVFAISFPEQIEAVYAARSEFANLVKAWPGRGRAFPKWRCAAALLRKMGATPAAPDSIGDDWAEYKKRKPANYSFATIPLSTSPAAELGPETELSELVSRLYAMLTS